MPESIDPRLYRPDPASHEGRVILVTGAGDGIGRAVALALAAHGATVVLLGKTQRKLESVYDEIVSAGQPRPALMPFNLETAAAPGYDALHDALESEFGRLDGLAHVAGILGARSPIDHYDVPMWCRVLHVNLTASFILTQVTLPLLRKSPDASVVFTSSGVGRKGRAYWGAYAVSKFGTEGLMQVLASELAETTRIRANSLNPGPVRTRMRLQAFPGEDRSRLLEPAAVAAPYLYLLGPDSVGINGRAFDCQ
ncbi:MAG: 3-oxoacyl-ACP reductase [Gammaproteobacteria bacterium SG8_30]|jgi:NAD(P)-dependent dehydrogenase (short-subunit alcohol dehydrogenase family)|nr:MAG: 3-oxoacyl-ACP reductase [Gammaproteobacteria bacterium SG8_30]